MSETLFTAEDPLEEALARAATARGISFHFDGHLTLDRMVVKLPDESEIWICDVNGELDGTLSDYTGLQAVLRSGPERRTTLPVHQSPELGMEARGLDAWRQEVTVLLDAVQQRIREVSADWYTATAVAALIGRGWTVDPAHPADGDGRILRHGDGSALRTHRRANRRGRARVSVTGLYPDTLRPFGPKEHAVVSVAAGRAPEVLAWQVFRHLLPRYRSVRSAIMEFNAERQRELDLRTRLAARVGELLPEVDRHRGDEDVRTLSGYVPGVGEDVAVRVSLFDNGLVDLHFDDLPGPWAVALLGTLAGLRTLQD
ncbi:hypothetical protein [Streptomyces sp. NRRL B-24484]|uniref:hypothetical protein n=1 Tax=Streptomyces sp. NRRL B-24484 TaxID=1463833 RepID=UPI0004C165EB|nr:hypothetical protein [Streptomyces sp. NRRL B-24484]